MAGLAISQTCWERDCVFLHQIPWTPWKKKQILKAGPPASRMLGCHGWKFFETYGFHIKICPKFGVWPRLSVAGHKTRQDSEIQSLRGALRVPVLTSSGKSNTGASQVVFHLDGLEGLWNPVEMLLWYLIMPRQVLYWKHKEPKVGRW